MFRFFKGKWVGEDELKDIKSKSDNLGKQLRQEDRMVHLLRDEFFKKKDELINIINEKEKTIQELKLEILRLKGE